MMGWYIEFVKGYPIISAVIQFAVLGTMGEVVAASIVAKKRVMPFSGKQLMAKALIWSFLAVCIKCAFVGFNGFTDALMHHKLLPWMEKYSRAFTVSVLMNLQFGPFLVLTHRLLDNVAAGEKNWNNIDKALYTLIWFWIPAHTVTFILPRELQIGLAAVWSVVLGVILGFYKRKAL